MVGAGVDEHRRLRAADALRSLPQATAIAIVFPLPILRADGMMSAA